MVESDILGREGSDSFWNKGRKVENQKVRVFLSKY